MADVFVVAIFIAVLSTNHAQSAQQQELSFFGMTLTFEISTETLSNIGSGFYFFVGYCVLSLIGSQLILHTIDNAKNTIAKTKTSDSSVENS
jgi:hypothetical protein